MKYQRYGISLILASISLASAPVHAGQTKKTQPPAQRQGGSGGHAGETVEKDGKRVLRDLVEKTNCEYVYFKDMVADQPYFNRILDFLGSINWWVREIYVKEINYLKVCQTEAPLIQISTEDADGLTIYEIESDQKIKQIAIRTENMIYLDMSEYRLLSPDQQAYTLFHEETHSFIPVKSRYGEVISRRNMKLRSFVAYVHKYESNPPSAEQFSLQVAENSMDLPRIGSYSFLDEMRPNIEAISNPSLPFEVRLKAAQGLRYSNEHYYILFMSQIYQEAQRIRDEAARREGELLNRLSQEWYQALIKGDIARMQQVLETHPGVKERVANTVVKTADIARDIGDCPLQEKPDTSRTIETCLLTVDYAKERQSYRTVRLRDSRGQIVLEGSGIFGGYNETISKMEAAIIRRDRALVAYLMPETNLKLESTWHKPGKRKWRFLTPYQLARVLNFQEIAEMIRQEMIRRNQNVIEP